MEMPADASPAEAGADASSDSSVSDANKNGDDVAHGVATDAVSDCDCRSAHTSTEADILTNGLQAEAFRPNVRDGSRYVLR